MAERGKLIVTWLFAAVWLAGCGGGAGGGSTPVQLTGITLESPATGLHYMGDLWASTWADDDRLYMAFGDGTGMKDCAPSLSLGAGDPSPVPGVVVDWSDGALGGSATRTGCPAGQWIPGLTRPAGAGFYDDFCNHNDCSACYALCRFTPNGLAAFSGSPPALADCAGANQCVVKHYWPVSFSDSLGKWLKPSSLIAVGSRIIAALHTPAGTVNEGYLAYTDDKGQNWDVAPGASPWTATSNSHFRVLVFIQMGKAYGDNSDGYVYALGMDHELYNDTGTLMDIYLARVPRNKIIDYTAWEYYQGTPGPGGDPCYNGLWSCRQTDAVALSGLYSSAQASAMYHPGLGKYLFLTGFADADAGGPFGALFAADQPWGPWQRVGTFPGPFIGALLPKGSGSRSVYFTAAGSASYPYTLNLVKLTVQTSRSGRAPAGKGCVSRNARTAIPSAGPPLILPPDALARLIPGFFLQLIELSINYYTKPVRADGGSVKSCSPCPRESRIMGSSLRQLTI